VLMSPKQKNRGKQLIKDLNAYVHGLHVKVGKLKSSIETLEENTKELKSGLRNKRQSTKRVR